MTKGKITLNLKKDVPRMTLTPRVTPKMTLKKKAPEDHRPIIRKKYVQANSKKSFG